MDVQAHDRLMTMIDSGELQFAAADPLRVCRLRREAQAHLLWARASAESGDRAGAFRLACRAGREECAAVLLSAGLETVDDGTGQVAFRAMATLSGSAATHRAVGRGVALSRVLATVEGGTHDPDRGDVKEAIAVAETLGRHLTGLVHRRYPEMSAEDRVG